MACKDRAITYLKSIGYNVVRVPKVDIQPLQILINEKGFLKPLGELSTLLLSGSQVNLPSIKRNGQTANISGQRTSDLSFGVGISILGSIIGAMGGSKLGLDAKYSQAKTIAFEFLDVLEDSIQIAELDQFLSDADVNPHSRYIAQLLEADEIYVTTATIKSNKINVEGKKSNKKNINVSVPEIKEIVGGTIEVTSQGENNSKVTFQGSIPLVFGFQAVRLVYEEGKYTSFKHLGAGEGAVSISGDPQPEYLSTQAAFVNLSSNL